MAQHRYRIKVESLDSTEQVSFEVTNHDDLFKIFQNAKNGTFPGDDRYSLILGLKLFSEHLLQKKDFKSSELLKPHFGAFMKAFKEEMK